jgi:3-methylcrotonyl-CoA carboxylase alpha subunit
MIAKMIAWGADRRRRWRRRTRPLAQLHIVGCTQRRGSCGRVVQSRFVRRQGDLDTALIGANVLRCSARHRRCRWKLAAAGVVTRTARRPMAAHRTTTRGRAATAGGMHGRLAPAPLRLRGAGPAPLSRGWSAPTTARCGWRSASADWPFAASSRGGELHDVTVDGQRHALTVYATGERLSIFSPMGSAAGAGDRSDRPAADGASEGGRLTAPMPGKVIAFLAKAGDAVKQGSRWR